MAKKEAAPPPPDVNEQVRSGLKSMLRGLVFLIPIVLLGWVAYMLFWGASPRNQLGTIEEVVAAYNRTVQPFVGPSGGRPNQAILSEFLAYFDSDSREFFADYADGMARSRLQFEQKAYEALNRDGRETEAMLFLVNRAPLSGFTPPTQTREVSPGVVEIVVRGRDNRDHRIQFQSGGGTWYIKDMAGLQQGLTQEVAPFLPK